MHEVFVVHDADAEANLAELAPDLFEPNQPALRVEPTPRKAKDQLAHDILAALRRRPRLAFRWSEGTTSDEDAAGLWCYAHGIEDILIPRADTIDYGCLRHVIQSVSGAVPHNFVLTWWLIDQSNGGALERLRPDMHAMKASIAHMQDSFRERRASRHRMRSLVAARRHGLSAKALCDAHPTIFCERLAKTLPVNQRNRAVQRFEAARRVIRSPRDFRDGTAALWYCLRAARSESDALIIYRGAQLAYLEQRIHLSMAADPWLAAEAAQEHVAKQAQQLLAYVDPLVAAIGAIALQTGFCARALSSVTTKDAHKGVVPTIAGLDADAMDPAIAALVRAQACRFPDRRTSLPLLVRTRADHRASRGGQPETAVVTEDRITVVLRALELERDLNFDHERWAEHREIKTWPL
ncbi:MAG: hypothetical protein WKF96_14325 [Solirubrobacteraceae bacterium]